MTTRRCLAHDLSAGQAARFHGCPSPETVVGDYDHNYVGHNYTGYKYIGPNFIGHSSICRDLYKAILISSRAFIEHTYIDPWLHRATAARTLTRCGCRYLAHTLPAEQAAKFHGCPEPGAVVEDYDLFISNYALNEPGLDFGGRLFWATFRGARHNYICHNYIGHNYIAGHARGPTAEGLGSNRDGGVGRVSLRRVPRYRRRSTAFDTKKMARSV